VVSQAEDLGPVGARKKIPAPMMIGAGIRLVQQNTLHNEALCWVYAVISSRAKDKARAPTKSSHPALSIALV